MAYPKLLFLLLFNEHCCGLMLVVKLLHERFPCGSRFLCAAIVDDVEQSDLTTPSRCLGGCPRERFLIEQADHI